MKIYNKFHIWAVWHLLKDEKFTYGGSCLPISLCWFKQEFLELLEYYIYNYMAIYEISPRPPYITFWLAKFINFVPEYFAPCYSMNSDSYSFLTSQQVAGQQKRHYHTQMVQQRPGGIIFQSLYFNGSRGLNNFENFGPIPKLMDADLI